MDNTSNTTKLVERASEMSNFIGEVIDTVGKAAETNLDVLQTNPDYADNKGKIDIMIVYSSSQYLNAKYYLHMINLMIQSYATTATTDDSHGVRMLAVNCLAQVGRLHQMAICNYLGAAKMLRSSFFAHMSDYTGDVVKGKKPADKATLDWYADLAIQLNESSEECPLSDGDPLEQIAHKFAGDNYAQPSMSIDDMPKLSD